MVHAESLTGSRYRTERHPTGLCCIPSFGWIEAAIAITTGLRVVLAKVLQQRLPSAAGDLA